jgi:serine protease AprX
MSTPLVAGCAAVLREALSKAQDETRTPNPSAALVKALLINGAEILTRGPGPRFVPSHSSGFGRVNVANSIAIIEGADGTGFVESQYSLNPDDASHSWQRTVHVGARIILKVTLMWSDPSSSMIRNRLFFDGWGNEKFDCRK